MPHIIAEISKDLIEDVPAFLNDLHQSLANQNTVSINAIKTRAIIVKDCVIGDDHQENAMCHVTLKLLPGRDDALRKKMAADLHAVILQYVDKSVSATVETALLDHPSYTK